MADTTETWQGCYDDQWGAMIVADAYAHPAKYAPGLAKRIIGEGLARGWWRAGELIGDPFGGIGGGGIFATYAGLRWVGVELEPVFAALAERNFAKHADCWGRMGRTPPRMVCGDSRQFAALVAGADAILSSPPYAQQVHDGNGIDTSKLTGNPAGANSQAHAEGYGSTPGQVGALPAGRVDSVITSPPFENQEPSHAQADTPSKARMLAGACGGTRFLDTAYGSSTGQVGNATGESYWQAVRDIYQQCRLALRPGGYMALVVKDYVRAGQRVPLCEDTWRLLLALGFAPVKRARAMLVRDTAHAGLFGDGPVVTRRERKSFFRRLHERKPGAVRIDWEEVLVVRAAELFTAAATNHQKPGE